ncbi:MAG: hypothetical protein IJ618_06510 [Prevotella sp.]|nr:hypothetical protein [Prevotella sp.]
MILLDVLPIDPAIRSGRVKEIVPIIKEVVIDSVKTVKDSVGATKDAVADSAAQTQLLLDNIGASQSDASLLLPIVIVALALAGCLYLAHLYRRKLA